jgi:hypothetical protein
MRSLPNPARKMPSYLSAERASSAVLTGSSTKGSPVSQRPLPFMSVNVSPHTPSSVIGPSQSGLGPHGLSDTAATPTRSGLVGTVVGLSVAVAVGGLLALAVGVALGAVVLVAVGAGGWVDVGAGLVGVGAACVAVSVGTDGAVGVAAGGLSCESPQAASATMASNQHGRTSRRKRDMIKVPP